MLCLASKNKTLQNKVATCNILIMSDKRKFIKEHYIYATILAVILITVLFLFNKENNEGFLDINTDIKNTKIFIDEKEKIPSEENKLKLDKGRHTVIISKTGFWPWIKEIDILKRQTLTIDPFFVPEQTNGFIISKNDQEYSKIIPLFDTQKTHIDWEKDENTPKIILDFEEEIKASDFYKDREDVIIIAIQNGIYALEINNESTPNFQPIYKGNSPIFIKKDNNSIYVKDGEILMEVAY